MKRFLTSLLLFGSLVTVTFAQDYSATKIPAFPDPLEYCAGQSGIVLTFIITDSPINDNGSPTDYSITASSGDLTLIPTGTPLSGTVNNNSSLVVAFLMNISGSATGNYTVDLLMSCTNVSCTDPDQTVSFNIEIGDGLPDVEIVPANPTICDGGMTSLTAQVNSGGDGATYAWSTLETTPSIDVSSAGMYTVTVTNGCGMSSASTTVSSNFVPDANITAATNTVCDGNPVTLNAGTSNGATNLSYEWTTLETTASINVTTAGSYSVTISNECGMDSATRNIFENETPDVSIDASVDAICDGSTTTLEAKLNNAATGVNYLWDDDDNSTTVSIEVGLADTYQVTASNTCGSDSDQITLEENITPDIMINASGAAICDGGNVDLDAELQNGATGVTYEWNTTEMTQMITVNSPSTYSVEATNDCGMDVEEITIASNMTPTAEITATGVFICDSEPDTLTANVTNAATGPFTYLWNDTPGSTVDEIEVATANNYQVTITNECGSGSDDIDVTANFTPDVLISGPASALCDGASGTLSADLLNAAMNVDYLWNTAEITQMITVSTSDSFIVEVSNACGMDLDTFVVDTNFTPVVEVMADPDTLICDGNADTLRAMVLNDANGVSYLWNTLETDTNILATVADTFFVDVTNECGMASDTIVTDTASSPSIVVFNCQVVGTELRVSVRAEDPDELPLTFVWKADGVPITPGGDFTIQIQDDISRLIVANATTTYDLVSFTCMIMNDCGMVETPVCGSNLPIELKYFAGELQDDIVLLKWATSTEIDNDFFTIERSFDGKAFEAITYMPGAGTTNEEQFYSFADVEGVGRAISNTIYYRLRQTDYDGTYTYSDVIFVRLEPTSILELINVATDGFDLKVNYFTPQDGDLEFSVFDLNGRRVLNRSLSTPEGFHQESLPLYDMPHGMYILQVTDGKKYLTHKFVR